MVYLLIYAFCEIKTGCKPVLQTSFSTEKACVKEKIAFEKDSKKFGSKGGYACVAVKGFE